MKPKSRQETKHTIKQEEKVMNMLTVLARREGSKKGNDALNVCLIFLSVN
jgi:hypothetical protein